MRNQQLDRLLHPNDQRKILSAVEAAERGTSAEFKVHVEATCRNPDTRAREVFRLLNVARTEQRNGVLLFLTVHDRRCVILVDEAVRHLRASRPWRDIADRLMLDLRHGKIGHGVAHALTSLSQLMAPHFPRTSDDVNEVWDEISTVDGPIAAVSGRR